MATGGVVGQGYTFSSPQAPANGWVLVASWAVLCQLFVINDGWIVKHFPTVILTVKQC